MHPNTCTHPKNTAKTQPNPQSTKTTNRDEFSENQSQSHTNNNINTVSYQNLIIKLATPRIRYPISPHTHPSTQTLQFPIFSYLHISTTNTHLSNNFKFSLPKKTSNPQPISQESDLHLKRATYISRERPSFLCVRSLLTKLLPPDVLHSFSLYHTCTPPTTNTTTIDTSNIFQSTK